MPARIQPITAADQHAALLMDQEQRRSAAIGVRAIAGKWHAMRMGMFQAARWGHDPYAVMAKAFAEFEPIILDALVAGHLRGQYRHALEVAPVIRAHEAAGPLKLAIDSYHGAIEFLRKRLELTDAELTVLAQKYSDQAVRVTTAAQAWAEEELQRAALEIVERGLHVNSGMAVMRAAMNQAGLTEGSNNLIETLVRTQTSIAYSNAQAIESVQPEMDNFLWGWTFVDVHDDRETVICNARHGVTLPKDDPWWANNWPPMHYNCRSLALPRYFKADGSPPNVPIVRPPGNEPPPGEGFGLFPGYSF